MGTKWDFLPENWREEHNSLFDAHEETKRQLATLVDATAQELTDAHMAAAKILKLRDERNTARRERDEARANEKEAQDHAGLFATRWNETKAQLAESALREGRLREALGMARDAVVQVMGDIHQHGEVSSGSMKRCTTAYCAANEALAALESLMGVKA